MKKLIFLLGRLPRLKFYLVLVAFAIFLIVAALSSLPHNRQAGTTAESDRPGIYSRAASNPAEAQSEIAKDKEALTVMMQNIYGPDWKPTAKDKREIEALSRGSYEINGKISDDEADPR